MTETQKTRLSERDAAELKQVYDRFREQVNTENSLYNQRIVWLVSMNAFLFATIGLILQAKFNPDLVDLDGTARFGWRLQDIVDAFLIMFCLVGFSISAIGDRLITNTSLVRIYIKDRWDTYLAGLGDVRDLDGYLSVEGGSGESVEHKMLSSDNIPKIFIITWAIMFCCVSTLWINRYFHLVDLAGG